MGRQVVIQGYCEKDIQKRYKGHHKTEYKKEAKKAARDLLYSQKVIDMIEEAETDHEIDRIMRDARHGLIK